MKHLTKKDFDETISSGKVVVDYWADWCGPCRMLAPIYEQLDSEMEDVTFAKVNADENQELTAEAGVRGLPTIVAYKDGEEVNRIVGLLPKDQLKQQILESFE